MTVRGWEARYVRILKKFGYSRRRDEESARMLDSAIVGDTGHDHLGALISKKPVIVIGAGPSIARSLPVLKRHRRVTKIAADGAVEFLMQNGVWPDVVVTDLDGDLESLQAASGRSIMVVHAHGDNMGRVTLAGRFPRCIGTTQSRPFGRISNFGGFTDGDRAVFLADHFGAEKIILLGMDFGRRIGRHSNTRRADRRTKLEKLKEAESLLTWLYARNREIYSVSAGGWAQKVSPEQISDIIAGGSRVM